MRIRDYVYNVDQIKNSRAVVWIQIYVARVNHIVSEEIAMTRFASRPSTRHVRECKRWALRVHVRLALQLWALKCIEKRQLYIREAYLWAWAWSERRRRQKEAIGMDAAGGSGLGRSTNHRTIRPTSPQRSRHLALNSSYQEQGRRERERRREMEMEAVGQGRDEVNRVSAKRERADAQHHHHRDPPMVG